MLDPWESLKVNSRRELLAAVQKGGGNFAVYDISEDCVHPRLLASVHITGRVGHARTFAPDGLTYYAGQNDFAPMLAIDLRDPSRSVPFYRFTGSSRWSVIGARALTGTTRRPRS